MSGRDAGNGEAMKEWFESICLMRKPFVSKVFGKEEKRGQSSKNWRSLMHTLKPSHRPCTSVKDPQQQDPKVLRLPVLKVHMRGLGESVIEAALSRAASCSLRPMLCFLKRLLTPLLLRC